MITDFQQLALTGAKMCLLSEIKGPKAVTGVVLFRYVKFCIVFTEIIVPFKKGTVPVILSNLPWQPLFLLKYHNCCSYFYYHKLH